MFLIYAKTIQLWNETKQSSHGKLRLFNDLAITTIFWLNKCFFLLLRCLQKFISSVLNLPNYRRHAFIIHTLASKLKWKTSRSRLRL
ncbi:hypothetical protein [Candidatus Enterovibrio altilux]|uniref:hypothetical protein n=1 Tax=Candidatus Enterovibrio altilux TaxID=1927128 RepID=UPI0037436A69